MPFLSIIMTVQNNENTIANSVLSVLSQKCKDYELILVDDGSMDGSPARCDLFGKINPRVRVIHKDRCGTAAARNEGLNAATGEWSVCMDATETLASDFVQYVSAEPQLRNAMTVLLNCRGLEDKYYRGLYNGSNALEKLCSGKIDGLAENMLVRSQLYKKNLFPEGPAWSDLYWAHKLLSESASVAFWRERAVYDAENQTSLITNEKTLNIPDMVNGWKARLSFLQENAPQMKEIWLRSVSDRLEDTLTLVLENNAGETGVNLKALQAFSKETDLIAFADPSEKKVIDKLNGNLLLLRLHYGLTHRIA